MKKPQKGGKYVTKQLIEAQVKTPIKTLID